MTGDPWVEDDLSEEDEDHLTASMGVGAATFTKASRKTMHASEVQAVHAQNTALRTVLVGLDPVWRPAASAFAAFRDAFGGGPNEVGGGELINFNHHVHTVSQALSSTLFRGGSISPRQLALLRLASQGWSTRLPFTASMMEDPEAYDHSRLQAVFQAGFAIATQHESDCARMSKLLGGVTSKVSSSRRRAYESHPYQDASRRRYADASLPRGGGRRSSGPSSSAARRDECSKCFGRHPTAGCDSERLCRSCRRPGHLARESNAPYSLSSTCSPMSGWQ